MIEIRPQPGRQEEFLSTSADIAIYGGSAGGGKTYALLMDPLRHINTKGFNGVIFRRETPQIRNPGGLWDQASEMYSLLKANLKQSILGVKFPKAFLKFSHLEYENDKFNWNGTEVCYLAFDELTQFTESQFWYLLTRNRSMCGVKPYVRATCNPDPDSFVASLVEWWIDQETGYAIPERSGIIRYLVRLNDKVYWADTAEELKAEFPDTEPKSFTFIHSSIYDNKILLEKDPGYLSNLQAQSMVIRERLLKGNWKIRETAGMIFRREWFEVVDKAPAKLRSRVRFWDRAASVPAKNNKDPDYTAGLRLARDYDGVFYIEDVVRFRATSLNMRKNIARIASQDGSGVMIGLEQEPGASGKIEVEDMIRYLVGYNARGFPARKDKVTRAMPASAQAEAGNIKIVKGSWNNDFLVEAENFDGNPKKHDDQIDCLSKTFELLNTSAPTLTTSVVAEEADYYNEERKSLV